MRVVHPGDDIPSILLEPNTWNPNVMSPEMFAKERASIRQFGFIDPLTVRKNKANSGYEIIDGEHRWRAGKLEGMTSFPCVVVECSDEAAKQLTIVLNETRGRPDQDRLSALLRDLSGTLERSQLQSVLPFEPARLDELLSEQRIDWTSLQARGDQIEQGRWVERVYRMPREVAEVVDEALAKIRSREDIEESWRALEVMAADVLAS